MDEQKGQWTINYEAEARRREKQREKRWDETLHWFGERVRWGEAETARQQNMPLSIPIGYHQAFALLDLPESSPAKQIQQRFHQLALKHHPDIGGSHQVMVALNRAYELALRYTQAA